MKKDSLELAISIQREEDRVTVEETSSPPAKQGADTGPACEHAATIQVTASALYHLLEVYDKTKTKDVRLLSRVFVSGIPCGKRTILKPGRTAYVVSKTNALGLWPGDEVVLECQEVRLVLNSDTMNDIPMKYDIIQLPEITDITKDLMDDLISPPNLDANVLPLGARLFFTYTCLPVWHVPAAFEGTPDEIKSTRDDAMVSRLQDRATMVEEEVIKEVATIRENLATAFPKECIAFCMLNMTVDQLQLRMCVLHAAFENQPEKVIIEYLEKHIRSPIGVLLRNVGRSLLFPERGIPDKQSYVESENMDVDLVFLVGSMQIVWDKLTKLGEEIKREFEEFRKR